jgi:hypothetical protein
MSLVHALAMLAVVLPPAAARAADRASQVVETNGGAIDPQVPVSSERIR